MTQHSNNDTPMTGYWDDDEREEGVLTEVTGPTNGYYSVTSSTGWSCGVSAEYGVVPKVGDAFVTWGSIGRPIRGQAINGVVLYYRTPAEQRAHDAKQADAAGAERIAEYEGQRAAFDARVLALPEPLRERIEGFRAHGGDSWRWEYESYELMCCEEATKIAALFPDADAVRAFADSDYAEQKAAFPAMDRAHSGNSWGASLMLARVLIERPDLAPKMHGALCPLVGCEKHGCYCTRVDDARPSALGSET